MGGVHEEGCLCKRVADMREKGNTKFESQAHFILLQKKTSGEQVLEPAAEERGGGGGA